MDSWTRTYIGSLFVVLTLISVVPAQDDSELPDPNSHQAENVVVDVEASDGAAGVEQVALPNQVVRMVRLMYDGSLQGRVRIIYPTGKTVPADAEIAFNQSEEVLQATKTNGDGMFELASFQPGRYTATVSIEAGSTDFQVDVLPYDTEATADQMLLDATLTPTPEIVADEKMLSSTPNTGSEIIDEEVVVEEEYIEPMGDYCGGFSGGGCCGCGGGFGFLGLAGLAGLAGLDGDNPIIIVSPLAP